MSQTWLILDVSYCCHRSFYALGNLATDGVGTGAVYGFFRDIDDLSDLFGPCRFVFAFDCGHDYRTSIYPEYKQNRRRSTDGEPGWVAAKLELKQQISNLRRKYLPACGYRNLLLQRGYEADDMIAAAVAAVPEQDEAVIVSADNDLWQLISSRVIVYNPATHKPVTAENFKRLHGIEPGLWPHIKALAGDKADGIEGIRGIGPKLAIDYYNGVLKPGSVAHKKIIEAGVAIHNRNIKLTRLPAPGANVPVWCDDELTAQRREFVFRRLGFNSLLDHRNTKLPPRRKGFIHD